MARLGLQAGLEATFEPAVSSGPLSRVTSRGPLELRGPFRRSGVLPWYFLRNTTAGIFAGDSYRVGLSVGQGVEVQVAASSASKVYAMPIDDASYEVHLAATGDSRLVWGPHATILQQGSSLHQRTLVSLSQGGAVILAELLSFGRLASSEFCSFRRFQSELLVTRDDGTPLYEERYVLSPGPELTASLAGHGVLLSVYGLGLKATAAEAWSSLAQEQPLAGACNLPNAAGIVLRALTDDLSTAATLAESALRLVCHPEERRV